MQTQQQQSQEKPQPQQLRAQTRQQRADPGRPVVLRQAGGTVESMSHPSAARVARESDERSPGSVATLAGEGVLRHGRHVLELILGPANSRPFDVRWWTGDVDRGCASPTPYTLVVARPGALRRMLLPPSEFAIIEAYLGGDIDVDGDMEAAAALGDLIAEHIRQPRKLPALLRALMALPARDNVTPVNALAPREARAEATVGHAGRPHAPARDAAAIRFHYDVGNDFYSLWLDPLMVYSCAYFKSPDFTLAQAQVAKLDHVCRKLRLRPGDRLLDVGCGWGALIVHAAANYGVIARGITLSEHQAELAEQRIAAAGLNERCHVEIRDYREPLESAPFDKIASVGMVEHVGLERLPDYFGALYRALAPGGLLLNHGIVSLSAARPKRFVDRVEHRLWRRGTFVDQYVFPDATLTPYQAVIGAAEAAGFETRDAESLREHYARTLRLWVGRLTAAWDDAMRLTDQRTVRTWRLYMAASAQGFGSGRLNIVQTLFARPRDGIANLPLTREDLYLA